MTDRSGLTVDPHVLRKHLSGATSPDVDIRALAFPTPASRTHRARMLRLVGQFYLRRLLRSCDRMAVRDAQPDRWQHLIDEVLQLPPDVCLPLVRSPEISTWIAAVDRPVPPWSGDDALGELVRLVQAMPDAGADGPMVAAVDEFWTATLTPGSPPASSSGEPARRSLQAKVDRSLEMVEAYWPQAALEVQDIVSLVLPLPAELPSYAERVTRAVANRPDSNYTTHATRGAIWTGPGVDVALAQILVHETGHNVLCSIIDLWDLAENQRDAVPSPIGSVRPIYGVFHAALSFTREAHFNALISDSSEAKTLPDFGAYSSEIEALARDSLQTLQRHASLTTMGESLIDGIIEGLVPE